MILNRETCCRIADLRCKEVINICDGARYGFVDDVEVDTCTGKLVTIIIRGRLKCFGLLGREEDVIIRWEEIEKIGEDIILVNYKSEITYVKERRWFF